MHLTPLLAWGFLGPVKELNDMCSMFKVSYNSQIYLFVLLNLTV